MPDKKNILFLMTDQHREDYIGYDPASVLETPNLDRLAGSVGLTDCTTVNPISTPARTALLTGKYSHQIGTLSMSGDLSRQHPTYLRALQDAGYWTAAVGKLHWLQGWEWGTARGEGHDLVGMKKQMKEFGLDHLWESSGKQLAVKNYCDYCAHLEEKGLLEDYRDWIESCSHNAHVARPDEHTGEPWPFAEEDYVDVVTGDRMVEAIRNRPADRPFMLFGSFCCPHPPYDPPESYLEAVPPEEEDFWEPFEKEWPPHIPDHLRRARRAYKAMINLVDRQVGRVLGMLEEEGILEDTVVLFTSDHGEQLGDLGHGGKQDPWPGSVSVPCAIRHPDHLEGRLVGSPVENTDLTATILDVAGLDPQEVLVRDWPAFHDRVPCRSLMPIVRGETDRVRDYAFSECEGRWQLIRDSEWIYVRQLDYEEPGRASEHLYNRVADPGCRNNLIEDPGHADVVQRFRDRREFVMDGTPPAQLRWAPLIGDPPRR
jgi:choline-sulfatase